MGIPTEVLDGLFFYMCVAVVVGTILCVVTYLVERKYGKY